MFASGPPPGFVEECRARFETRRMEREDMQIHELGSRDAKQTTAPCFYDKCEAHIPKTMPKREVPANVSFF